MNEIAQNETSSERKIKEEVDFGRGRIEICRNKPDDNIIPLTKKASLPLMFAGGYLGDATVPWYVNAFGKRGRDTVGIAYTGKRKSNKSELVQKEGLSIRVPELEYEKALDLLEVLDKMEISQIDIVAESAGAIRTLIAVGLRPEKFRNVILVHPAGLDKRESFSTHGRVIHHQVRTLMDPRLLSERVRRKLRRTSISDEDKASEREGIGYIRPEQKAVALSQFDTLLSELKQKHPHLNFSIIADKHDFNFRWRRLQKVNKQNLFAFIQSHWKGHGIGHKQERIGEIDGLLQRMEQENTRRDANFNSSQQVA